MEESGVENVPKTALWKRLFRVPAFYCLFALIGCIIALVHSEPSIHNVHVIRNHQDSIVTLPYSEEMGKGEIFYVEMDVVPSWAKNFSIKLTPDDCFKAIFINDAEVSLDKYPDHCSWAKGFTIPAKDLEKFAGEADTYHFSMKVENGGGAAGINATAFTVSIAKNLLYIFAALLVAIITFSIGCKLHINKKLLLLFLLGLFLRVAYTQNTGYRERSYDVDGHLEYINIIADKHHIPDASEGWSCYHPPLYYLGAVPVKYISSWFGLSQTGATQWYSLFISLATLAFGLACLRIFAFGRAFWIAAILWTFWPGFVLSAPRIGNDILFYFAHVLCLWACLRYITESKGNFLLIAVLSAFAAYWSKSTGAITIALTALTMVIHFIPRVFSYAKKFKSEYFSIGIFAALSITAGALMLRSKGLIANTSGLNGHLKVGKDPVHFLYFDIPNFIAQPFTSAWADGKGREYFWNYLAKTSLFGEFELTSSELGIWLATIISVAFIILLIIGIIGLWKTKWSKASIILGAQAIAFFTATAYLRYKYPYSCSNDFRFIMPVLLSCGYCVGNGIFAGNTSLRWKFFGSITTAIFVGCSIALILIL